MSENKTIGLTLGQKSSAAALIVLTLARACAESDTIYGNLIRYHHAVDPEVLSEMIIAMQSNRENGKFELNETAVLSMVAASDIARKMFASDEFDEIMKTQDVPEVNALARANIIDFSNFIINELFNNGTFKKEIDELLIQLKKTIQP